MINTKSPHLEVDDLVLEIFLRLPLHSIQRFKTVCKNWHSLITNPTFRKLWCRRNLKPSTGLFLHECPNPNPTNFVQFLSFKPTTVLPRLRSNFKIIQSCNGLLLCLTKTSLEREYHVYNPTTDTCHTLPKLGKAGRMSLAFDPKKSLHYKVICRYLFDRENYDIYIYSSDTLYWNKAGSMPNNPPRPNNPPSVDYRGVYWNGAIHWMNQLSCFNIENHTFKTMPEPVVYSRRKNCYLEMSCDRLSCTEVRYSGPGHSGRVNVYELKRDYSEWVLKHHVEFDNWYNSVLSVVHGEEEDDSFLVLDTKTGIVRYNLVSKTSEQLPVSLKGKYVRHAFQYIEYY